MMEVMIDAGRRIAEIVQVSVGSNTLRVRVRYFDATDGGNVDRWVDIAEVDLPRQIQGLMTVSQYIAAAAGRLNGGRS